MRKASLYLDDQIALDKPFHSKEMKNFPLSETFLRLKKTEFTKTSSS